MLSVPSIATTVARHPVLIGYTDGSPLDPLRGHDLIRQGWCAVVFPVALGPAPPGQAVLVPAGFVHLEYAHVGAPVWDPFNERFNRAFRPAEVIVRARPPEALGRQEQVTARLRIRMDATGYRLRVSGLAGPGAERAGSEVLIEQFDSPREIDLVIERADRFRDAAGRYVLDLRVERAGRAARTPKAPAGRPPPPGGHHGRVTDADDMIGWAFESIDVTLRGVRK